MLAITFNHNRCLCNRFKHF